MLAELEKKAPEKLTSDEALSMAEARAFNRRAEARALSERLGGDPGLAKDPAVFSKLIGFSRHPESARDARGAMMRLPGALSADLLYEVWTGTPDRTDETELARLLLLGPDIRAKASKAVLVAVDLREAGTCEENAKLLPSAIEIGDKRALIPITRLFRRTGCGANKRQDCYPCLREGDTLKSALVAVKKRREPRLGSP
jgi:hypothetical protein